MTEIIKHLNKKFEQKKAEEILEYFLKKYKGEITFSSSFGAEDQLLTDMITKIEKDTKIFTLDTYVLPPQTYDVMKKTNTRYEITVESYQPTYEELQQLYKKQGLNGFYESVENRKECCFVRKIVPLKKALMGMRVWITGLRAEQSVTRTEMQLLEWDEGNDIIKLNPLVLWTHEEVWTYIKENDVPYNELHDKGYPSIGCAPCTRAVKEGDDIRSGRWWWENPEHKECGLHFK